MRLIKPDVVRICDQAVTQFCRVTGSGEPTCRHVSFRFDVRGHWRNLSDGRTVWIRPHQRGVEHDLYRPKAYKVE